MNNCEHHIAYHVECTGIYRSMRKNSIFTFKQLCIRIYTCVFFGWLWREMAWTCMNLIRPCRAISRACNVIPSEERYWTPQFWNITSVRPSIFPSLRTEKKHILGICCCSSQHRQESLNADAATARAFEPKPWQHLDDHPCPVSFRDTWQTNWYSVHSIVSCE